MIHLVTIQVSLKNPIGRVVKVGKYYSEKDFKTYKVLVRETIEGLGFEVDGIFAVHDDIPEGQAITPIPIAASEKKHIEKHVEPEMNINDLPQYQNKPKFTTKNPNP